MAPSNPPDERPTNSSQAIHSRLYSPTKPVRPPETKGPAYPVRHTPAPGVPSANTRTPDVLVPEVLTAAAPVPVDPDPADPAPRALPPAVPVPVDPDPAAPAHRDSSDNSSFTNFEMDADATDLYQAPCHAPPVIPEAAVLMVQRRVDQHPNIPGAIPVPPQSQFRQLLGHLKEKGLARKFYLTTVLERLVTCEALLDTAADITLMSAALFNALKTAITNPNMTVKLQQCAIQVQAYSTVGTQMQGVAPIHLTIGPTEVVHPIYVSPLDSIPLLIGKDLLNRFEPLIDFRTLQIWAQVRNPRPVASSTDCQVFNLAIEGTTKPAGSPKITMPPPTQNCTKPNFLCRITQTTLEPQCYHIQHGVTLQDHFVHDIVLALWTEKSAIDLDLFLSLQRHTPDLPYVTKPFRFPLGTQPQTIQQAQGVCALQVTWNQRHLLHYFLVIPKLAHQLYIGADVLLRLAAHVDTINDILWCPPNTRAATPSTDTKHLRSGQTVPELCEAVTSADTVVPAYSKGVPVKLNLNTGQTLTNPVVTFHPAKACLRLGLSLEASPLLEVRSRSLHILFNNCTAATIRVPKRLILGYLIDYNFYDIEPQVPVIGCLPQSLTPDQLDPNTAFTAPSQQIAVTSIAPVPPENVHRMEAANKGLAIYSIASEPDDTPLTATGGGTPQTSSDPYPDFEMQVQQVLSDADALTCDTDRHRLRQLLYKFKNSFAKDSLDCGLTDIHMVRIPTRPDAPPTYVRQYKIPLASYEPVQEIIDEMLQKGIIRPCNSTYSSPIWPVLKPNGKWRPTIDYRKLNQQVPLSRWPMTQLDQELHKARGAKFFTAVDVASGFWTIPVHPDDQHKLAFTFAERQYTFNRCPFGYANSPAEFNIFLNKACPDARLRGNLIYVDDILMKSPTLDEHLTEIDHVLTQLAAAGAKLSLKKGQWCKSKVNYVGLLIGPDGIEPQSCRTQAIRNIATPASVSDLRSFLGVCNYSRQFIEHFADIARPLTELLKKDIEFTWSATQQAAMDELIRCLCSAPCLAYPNPAKEFHLEAGFSASCLSAGLYQLYDSDKRVVAYASKTLSPHETKFSDCEKALLSTVWAVTHFSNYIGAQKVIIDTCHQPVTFLHSQRIRDGTVTNSRIATWLMALEGRDIEVRYAQNKRLPLANDLAACQNCSTNSPGPGLLPTALVVPAPANHHYYDDNVCQDMVTAYVDGCAFTRDGTLKAGAGIVWVNDVPCPSQQFQLGHHTSQWAEITAVLITLQTAADHNVLHLLICTDSNYARLTFLCHLPMWKQNGFRTSNNKPIKNQEIIQACDDIITTNNMEVYWKKVRGHSKQPGVDKTLNDQADALAKEGALHGTLWTPNSHPPTPIVAVVTRHHTDTSQTALPLCPQIENSDLITLQATDNAIATMIKHLSDPNANPIDPSLIRDDKPLRRLYAVKHDLRLLQGILFHVTDEHTSPQLVVPQCQRGVMIEYAHDAPYAGHRDAKTTYETLKAVAYWSKMRRDVKEYVETCLQCCQFQPTKPNHRAPLHDRGICFPWSDLQIDWVGPMTRSTRGNKYLLTVTCAFTKWVEGLPAPDNSAQTTACLLVNHVISRFGLPMRVNSDQGTHFTAEIMTEVWKLLGVKAQFHISYHPQSSGQVERANRTVIGMLKKYVAANQKDWDIKLPLVLMAIRATPSRSTGVTPFELMTGRQMVLPLHLLYQPGDSNLVTAYTTHQYLQELQQHLKSTFAFAQHTLQDSARGRKAYYDRKASQQELQVGDQVWYYSFTPPTQSTRAGSQQLSKKFLPHWTGPYHIVDKLSPVAYRINLNKRSKEPLLKWVHRNQIKVHKGRAREAPEAAITTPAAT